MYGNAGPPKKYSTPRGAKGNAEVSRLCQKCASTGHWTFECKSDADAGRKTTPRLSRSQMLRWNIKQRRKEFLPEPTEREAYDAQVKEVERVLVAEAREEAKKKKQRLEKLRDVKDGEESSDDDGNDADADNSSIHAHVKGDVVRIKDEKEEDDATSV